jgi:hypothetical protein
MDYISDLINMHRYPLKIQWFIQSIIKFNVKLCHKRIIYKKF